jgi:hypothetical protein
MKRSFARLRSIHARMPRIALWANVESFTWEQAPNRVESALVPAAFPRLLAQMAAVSPWAEEVVSFAVEGVLEKPGSPFPLGQPGYSAQLGRDYLDFLAGHGRWPLLAASFAGGLTHAATGRPATLSSAPAPGHGKGGLTDGRMGDEDMNNPDWLGFENHDLEAVIDLGESRPIDTLAARFLQYAPAGIRLPSRVEFALADGDGGFRPIPPVRLESWPHDRHDCWIDMAVAGNLNARARFLRVRAVNAGPWLFADEVLVNPRATR